MPGQKAFRRLTQNNIFPILFGSLDFPVACYVTTICVHPYESQLQMYPAQELLATAKSAIGETCCRNVGGEGAVTT